MQPHHLIGGSLAFAGIVDLVILLLFILPKMKAPPQTKKILSLAIGGSGVAMIIAGAVLSLVGAAWFD